MAGLTNLHKEWLYKTCGADEWRITTMNQGSRAAAILGIWEKFTAKFPALGVVPDERDDKEGYKLERAEVRDVNIVQHGLLMRKKGLMKYLKHRRILSLAPPGWHPDDEPEDSPGEEYLGDFAPIWNGRTAGLG